MTEDHETDYKQPTLANLDYLKAVNEEVFFIRDNYEDEKIDLLNSLALTAMTYGSRHGLVLDFTRM